MPHPPRKLGTFPENSQSFGRRLLTGPRQRTTASPRRHCEEPPYLRRRGNLNSAHCKDSGKTAIPSALGDRAPREQFCNLRLSRRCFFIIRTVCFPAFSFQSFRSISVPAHNDAWVCAPTVRPQSAKKVRSPVLRVLRGRTVCEALR